MARRKSKKELEETLVDIVEVRDQAVGFYEKNQKMLIIIAAGILLLVGGYLAYQMLYMAPRAKKAQNAMYMAEYQFSRDSFALALDNPGQDYDGFVDIIYNYKGTDQANTAKYYAGISYLNLGRYSDAVEMLKTFNAPTDITKATKFGALGDAYSEMDEMGNAESSYKKAAAATDLEAIAPYYLRKLALLYRFQGNEEKAKATFQQIVDKYPDTEWGREAEKFVMK